MKKLLMILVLISFVGFGQTYRKQVAGADTISASVTGNYYKHNLTYFCGDIFTIGSYAIKYTIVTTDTIEICADSFFVKTVGLSNVFELASDESYTSPEFSVSYGTSFNNLYWRRKVVSGETGSSIVRFIISGY